MCRDCTVLHFFGDSAELAKKSVYEQKWHFQHGKETDHHKSPESTIALAFPSLTTEPFFSLESTRNTGPFTFLSPTKRWILILRRAERLGWHWWKHWPARQRRQTYRTLITNDIVSKKNSDIGNISSHQSYRANNILNDWLRDVLWTLRYFGQCRYNILLLTRTTLDR